MLRPPIRRAMRVLDRAAFNQDVLISAAKIFEIKNVSRIRNAFEKSNDLLSARGITVIQPDHTELVPSKKKCVLLRPGIKHNDVSTWSETVRNFVDGGEIRLIPYNLRLGYNSWSTHEILSAVLPEELLADIPTAFQAVGHIAQLNLRDQYLPYKKIIADVTLDKNPSVRTVINKLDTLGEDNQFRVLPYEVLAGDDESIVEHREWGTSYRFDFAKVFWNSRLSSEHERLVKKFQKGEAVCDVMAGVGPFAIPAAKRGVFVWANDLNPDCYKGLVESMKLNHVSELVKASCRDGHAFIREATQDLLQNSHIAKLPMQISRTDAKAAGIKPSEQYMALEAPKTFSHYIMNLPSTAVDFLPDFSGLYAGHEDLFEPNTATRLPMIHCYTFGLKLEGDSDEAEAYAKEMVCKRMSEKLGYELRPNDPDIEMYEVRGVAPNKLQFRVSFRLPPEVAFRKV